MEREDDRTVVGRHRAEERRPGRRSPRVAVLGAVDRREEVAARSEGSAELEPVAPAPRRIARDLGGDARREVLHEVADLGRHRRTIPSVARLATAVGVGAKSQRERWSATTRLISSGMRRSKLRRPASTWATGTPSFEAASAPASVEFVSPNDEHGVGPRVGEDRLEGEEHRARLLRVVAAADPEAVVRPGSSELGEERSGHRVVVVLARVDEDLVVTGAQDRAAARRP